jgi:hypothetical protein
MKALLTVILVAITISCKSQVTLDNLSHNEDLNYYLANININKIVRYSIFNDGLYITFFPFADFRHTPDDLNNDGHEVQTSYLISVSPDGEYVESSTYQIGPFMLPKIISVTQGDYPNFTVEIESGVFNNKVITHHDVKAKQ